MTLNELLHGQFSGTAGYGALAGLGMGVVVALCSNGETGEKVFNAATYAMVGVISAVASHGFFLLAGSMSAAVGLGIGSFLITVILLSEIKNSGEVAGSVLLGLVAGGVLGGAAGFTVGLVGRGVVFLASAVSRR